MTTITKSTIGSSSAPRTNPDSKDAIALLKADHQDIADLFAQYGNAATNPAKKELVAAICTALTVHMGIEEDIFYPEVRQVLKKGLLVPEALVEHAGIQALMAQIEGIEPDGDTYDAKVKVLSEYVKHHVKEEHYELFPKLRGTSLDLNELGLRMAVRKEALLTARH